MESGGEMAVVMICLIWLFWLFNQFVVLIFSLNFLISQIGQAYEEVISTSMITRYTYRCFMNRESSILLRLLGIC